MRMISVSPGSRRWLWPAFTAVALGLSVAPQAASAQATFRPPDEGYQGVILSAFAAFIVPMGKDLELGGRKPDVGPGVGAAIRWVFPNAISVGGGVRWSTHNSAGFTGNTQFLSLYGQIGYTFIFDTTPIRPTLGGRIGWTSQKLPAAFNANRNGLDIGAFGGVEVPLSQVVSLTGALTFDFLVLQELPGNPVDGTAQLFAIEAGVVIIP